MAADTDGLINLKSLKIGDRIIRYIIVATTKVHSGYCEKYSHLPLFFGADVLNNSGCSDAKNLGRIHAKFSEDGLASKVCLPKGCKIKGIRGSADAGWFYSIHGLFRIAFRFYPRNELKILLEKMHGLWMALVEEPLLERVTTVMEVTQNIVIEHLEEILENSKYNPDIGSSEENRIPVNVKEGQTSVEDENYEGLPTGTSDGAKLKSKVTPSSDITSDCIQNGSQQKVKQYQELSLEAQSKGDKMSCNFLGLTVEKIIPRLNEVFRDEQSCQLVTSYIDSFVDLLIDEEANIIEQQSTSFPIKLIKDYMDLKCNRTVDSPQDHELAIHVVSSWVGDRFFLFKDIIKHNIDTFKQNYITTITELPSPEEIIRTVYPSAMYSLIYLWIRGTGENVLDGQDNVEEAKKIRSICLLVLELLNGSPITGLGHWIFSAIQGSIQV